LGGAVCLAYFLILQVFLNRLRQAGSLQCPPEAQG